MAVILLVDELAAVKDTGHPEVEARLAIGLVYRSTLHAELDVSCPETYRYVESVVIALVVLLFIRVPFVPMDGI